MFAAAIMKNISWKKILQIALIVVVTCAGVAGVVEKTRKYINTRIDRMLARKLSSPTDADIKKLVKFGQGRQSVRGWRFGGTRAAPGAR